jgi:hypothetical protein
MRYRVMRADDNGNEVEVTRVETREEAERIARDFEARGHKQMYWIEPVDEARRHGPSFSP